MKTYTVEQIRKYILSQDSLGDVLYNLNEAKIDAANEEPEYKCLGCGEELTSEEDQREGYCFDCN